VLAGIGLDLAAIDGHPAQLHRAQLQRQFEHLHKQPFQRLQMNAPKLGDRPEIRLVARRQNAKSHVLDQNAAPTAARRRRPRNSHRPAPWSSSADDP
jgi:hypothetical protein